GLADAIDRGDLSAATDAIARAPEQTPEGTEGVVRGCTHYPLVADTILATLPVGVRLFDSGQAVAAQAIRKVDGLGRVSTGEGTVRVLNSGRPGALPPSAATYESGLVLGARI